MDLMNRSTMIIAIALSVIVVSGIMTPIIADALNSGGSGGSSGGDSTPGYVNEGVSYLKKTYGEDYSIKITNNENSVVIEKDNNTILTLNKGDEYWKIPLLMTFNADYRWYMILEYLYGSETLSSSERYLCASSITAGTDPNNSSYDGALEDYFDVGGYCTLDVTNDGNIAVAQYGSDDSEWYSDSFFADYCISDEGEYVYADKPTVSADTIIPIILPDYIEKRGELHIGPHEEGSQGVEMQMQNHSYPSYASAYFTKLDDPSATYTLTVTGTTYSDAQINGASCEAIGGMNCGAIIGSNWNVGVMPNGGDVYFKWNNQYWKKAVIVGSDVTLYNAAETQSTQISGAKYCFWPDGDYVETYNNPYANDSTEIFACGQYQLDDNTTRKYGFIYVEGSLENNNIYTTSGPNGVNITNQGQGQFIYNTWDHTSIWKIEATVDDSPVTLSFSSSVSGANVFNMFCIAPKDVTVLCINNNQEHYPPDDTDVVLEYSYYMSGLGTITEINQNGSTPLGMFAFSGSYLYWISDDDDGTLMPSDIQYTFNTTETTNGIRLDGITIESVWGSDESLTETDTFTKFIVPTVVGSEETGQSEGSDAGWIAAGGESVIMAWGYDDGKIGLYHPEGDDFYVQDMNTTPILPIAIGDKWFIYMDSVPDSDTNMNMKITGDISSSGLSVDYTSLPYISILGEITISGTTISFIKDLSTYELDGLVAYINDSGPMRCWYNENAKTTGTVYTGSLINYLNVSQQEQLGYSLCTVTSGTISSPTVAYSNGWYGHNSTYYPNVVGDVTAQFVKNGSTISGLKLSGTYGNGASPVINPGGGNTTLSIAPVFQDGNGMESFEYQLDLTGQTAPESNQGYANESFLFVIGTPDESESGGGSGRSSTPASLTAMMSAVPLIVLIGIAFVGFKMFRMQ